MSNRALDWAWEAAGLTPMQKLVLVALADHANADEGMTCHPGTLRLRRRLCCSERALRNAVMALEAAKYIAREVKEGVGTTYTVLCGPRHVVHGSDPRQQTLPLAPEQAETHARRARVKRPPTPARDAGLGDQPRHEVPPTHAPGAAEPLRTQTLVTTLSPSGPAAPSLRVVAGTAVDPKPTPKPDPKGARLPPDWQPTPELVQFARELKLDPQHITANFRDYWHSRPGAGGRKVDWPATYRVWCRKEAERTVRHARQPQQHTPESIARSALRAAGVPIDEGDYLQPQAAGLLG